MEEWKGCRYGRGCELFLVPHACKMDHSMLFSPYFLPFPLSVTGLECWVGVGGSQEGLHTVTPKRVTLDYQVPVSKALEETLIIMKILYSQALL